MSIVCWRTGLFTCFFPSLLLYFGRYSICGTPSFVRSCARARAYPSICHFCVCMYVLGVMCASVCVRAGWERNEKWMCVKRVRVYHWLSSKEVLFVYCVSTEIYLIEICKQTKTDFFLYLFWLFWSGLYSQQRYCYAQLFVFFVCASGRINNCQQKTRLELSVKWISHLRVNGL